MRIELWKKNEYGEGAILFSSTNLEQVIKQADQYLYDTNLENALTADEKMRNWECYSIHVVDKEGKQKNNVLYAGNMLDGKHRVYEYDGTKWNMRLIQSNDSVRVYLGSVGTKNVPGKPWYLVDEKKQIVTILKKDPTSKQASRQAELLDRRDSLFFKLIA